MCGFNALGVLLLGNISGWPGQEVCHVLGVLTETSGIKRAVDAGNNRASLDGPECANACIVPACMAQLLQRVKVQLRIRIIIIVVEIQPPVEQRPDTRIRGGKWGEGVTSETVFTAPHFRPS